MNILLTISKVSIILMLVIGFSKFLIVDKFLFTKKYYLKLIDIIGTVLVCLTISTFGSFVIWLTWWLIIKK